MTMPLRCIIASDFRRIVVCCRFGVRAAHFAAARGQAQRRQDCRQPEMVPRRRDHARAAGSGQAAACAGLPTIRRAMAPTARVAGRERAPQSPRWRASRSWRRAISPAAGNMPTTCTKCLEFILASCQESGLIAADQSHGPMYGHGFATLFLGEVYGMTGDEQVKEKLQRAVRLIEQTQNPEGGWRYQPVPLDADISVTICQIMGLAPPATPASRWKKARSTTRSSTSAVARTPTADSATWPTKAAAEDRALRDRRRASRRFITPACSRATTSSAACAYLKQFIPGKGKPADVEGHYFYGHYYAVQAMFLAGGDYWASWYPGDPRSADRPPATHHRRLVRRRFRRLRHRDGADHPPDAQPLSAGLYWQGSGKLNNRNHK